MINKDEVLTLSDKKKYFVFDSIMYENINYVIIFEIDDISEKSIGIPIIMMNDLKNNKLSTVTDKTLLFTLANIFGNNNELLDFE